MDFITNTHGNTVPHDGGRGFCGAQGSLDPVLRTNTNFRPFPTSGDDWVRFYRSSPFEFLSGASSPFPLA
jgi:hypothetical protein